MSRPPGNAQFPDYRFGGNAFPPNTNRRLDKIKKKNGYTYESELLRLMVAKGLDAVEAEANS